MTDTPTPAPSGGTMPNYSEVARRFWGALTAGRDYATWPCWDDMDDDAHADIEFAVSRTFDAFTAFTPPASAPGSGEDEWWEAAECEAWAQARQHASEIGWRDFDKAESVAAAATGSLRFATLSAIRRARSEGEAKGRREGMAEVDKEVAKRLAPIVERLDAICAQLLAARAEALEWAYDNTGLDMSFSSRHRDKAHFVRDGLAALRAKGGGE